MRLPPIGLACLSLAFAACSLSVRAEDLPGTIAKVKPAVVGIATLKKGRTPPILFIGTGFVVGDGLTVITNAHVVKQPGIDDGSELLGVLTSSNQAAADMRSATIVNTDRERDLAQLRIAGTPLPTLKLGNSDSVLEGHSLVFTGFPLGMILGFHHVTHRALVAAITPVVDPAPTSQILNPKMIAQLRSAPYKVFQLDGTAYPGSSGSPLYDPATGEVLGIINKVAVKGTKEAALTQPSGITYAIPARHIHELLDRQPAQPAAK
ncbi:S1 family peptidase [Noviherbaspirillum denitrificans]|uniref:Peptidase S1 n=1 Tax=Noviherbaspirillum denitrificans TaxID=1968433 RepID=A0A254TEI7_9BURK|nr:serine protease [Noviherbaspirillum denitrificans]OWW21014.1 peptidase S1 [Noviherbaspirillum denitrificans]